MTRLSDQEQALRETIAEDAAEDLELGRDSGAHVTGGAEAVPAKKHLAGVKYEDTTINSGAGTAK